MQADLKPTTIATENEPAGVHPVTMAWFLLLAGMIAGILWNSATFVSQAYILPAVAIGTLCAMLLGSLAPMALKYKLGTIVAGLGVVLGVSGHHRATTAEDSNEIRQFIHPQQPRLFTLHGVLVEREIQKPPSPDDSPTCRLIIRADCITGQDEKRTCAGRFLMETTEDYGQLVAVGYPVVVTGWLESFPESLNPGEWSARHYWSTRGVQAYMDARHRGTLAADQEARPVLWRVWRDRVRAACRNTIARHLPAAQAPLVEALVLGIREAVPESARALFRDTGTMHLLAISGLHLQVVAMFVMWLAGRLGLGQNSASAVVIVTSAAYAMLVTGGSSVARATLMASAIALAAIRQRPGAFWNRLAMSGAFVLWINPLDLFDAGAQLSFLGTAGIYEASILWQRLATRLPGQGDGHPLEFILTAGSMPFFFEDHDNLAPNRRLRLFRHAWVGLLFSGMIFKQLVQALFISTVVWLVTVVLVAFHFESVNPVAILVNIPLVPATSVALVLGLAGMLLGLSGLGFAGACFLAASGQLMQYSLVILDYALQYGTAPLAWVSLQSWAVVVFYLLCGLIYMPWLVQSSRKVRTGISILPLAWIILTTLATSHWHGRPPDFLEVEMLAVDHGLAVLVRWPDGQNWLYDCGQMGRPAVGRRVVGPALRERGVNTIHKLMISHADSDPFNGVPSLIESGVQIQSLVSTPNFFQSRDPDAMQLKHLLAGLNIPFQPVASGSTLRHDTLGQARVLYPSPETRPGRADNATSLVLELASLGTKMLLTGDLEGQGLEEFAENCNAQTFDIISAPHHGGLTSNPGWLYEKISPRLVLSSQGRNRYGMTAGLQSHMARFCPGGQLRTTAADGAVRLAWSPQGVRVTCFRNTQPELQLAHRHALLEGGSAGAAQVVLDP